jgi:preprotein translocase subunit SecA/nephrocystin-3
MQDERDYLMKRTFPKLRKLAAERDVTLTELDLRWGITEEEAQSGKVVEICLREIENSVPFFIGIIGNRYGWIPKSKDLSESITERFTDVSKYIKQELSVTEIEMRFGVLARKEDMHAYFYIKEQEENLEKVDELEKLNNLKQDVVKSRYPSSNYKSPRDLAKQVEEAFIKLLDTLFPKGNLSELEKERIGQRSYMNQLCQNYIKKESNFEFLDKWLASTNSYQLVVTGASGLGKSALIANWIKMKLTDKNCEYNIIYHFTGNGGSESSSEHITKSIANEIKDIYGRVDDELGSETKLEDLFFKVSFEGDKPLLIVIDAINQIADINNAKLLNWLPVPTKGIKILFSTLENDRTMEVFRHRDYDIFTLQPLDDESMSQLVKKYLRFYGKSLAEQQVERIVKCSQSKNTLVLKTLLDELINIGIHENLDDIINDYHATKSIVDFYQNLLKRYEGDYGSEFVKHALSLIFVSKEGLQEYIIQKLTNVPILIWSQFYCSLINNFVIKNGKLKFSHSYIRSAVFNRYLIEDKKWENNCRKEILNYTKKHNIIDTFFEEPFQFFMIQNKKSLEKLYKRYMSKPEVTELIYRYDKYNCINYWNILRSHGYDMHSLVEYNFSKKDLYKSQRMIFEFTSLARMFGDNELVLKLADKHLEIITNAHNVSKDLLIKSYNDVANAFAWSNHDNDDFHKAINYYFKAHEIAGNTSSKELAVTYNGLAQCCIIGQKNDLALFFGEKALELNKKFYGDIHYEIAVNLNVIALAHTGQGDYSKAIEAFTKAIRILISLYGNYSTELIVAYYNLADCQLYINNLQPALQSISKAIEIIDMIFGEKYHDIESYIHLKNDILARIEENKLS